MKASVSVLDLHVTIFKVSILRNTTNVSLFIIFLFLKMFFPFLESAVCLQSLFIFFSGYCDVFLKCRKVDAEGPLVRLKNLLFNQETLLTIVQWVTEFWWAVLLMGIAFVIFMAVFIKCFAIHTPSSNPR